jgi:hypothetical protein
MTMEGILLEVALGIVGTGLCGLIVMLIKLGGKIEWICKKLGKTDDKLTELLVMHNHADDYGFGTNNTNELLKGQIQALTALTKSVDALVQEIKLERELAKAQADRVAKPQTACID